MSIVQLNVESGCFGGSHRFYHNQLKQFFQPFADAGVELVFFCGGSKSNDKLKKLLPKIDSSYSKYHRILESVDRDKKLPRCQRAEFRLTLGLYEEGIARQYGEYHLSGGNLNKDMVKYCHQDDNVVAIMAKDSDFLVYNLKSVQYWSCGSEHLHFGEHTTVAFHQTALLAHMKLSPYQFHALISAAGVILDDPKTHRRNVRRDVLGDKHRESIQVIDKLCEWVRNNVAEDDEKIHLDQLTNGIFSYNLEQYHYNMEKQHKNYDVNANDVQVPSTDPAMAHFKSIWTIFCGQPIRVEQNFIDLLQWTDDPNALAYHHLTVIVLRRIAGVILRHLNDESLKRSFVLKGGHRERCKTFEKSPIYPECEYYYSLVVGYRYICITAIDFNQFSSANRFFQLEMLIAVSLAREKG